MAIYANDLSGLSAAAVADYEAQTRRTGLNQNFLAALAAERNRRALGEALSGPITTARMSIERLAWGMSALESGM